jgi:hypothetical protein
VSPRVNVDKTKLQKYCITLAYSMPGKYSGPNGGLLLYYMKTDGTRLSPPLMRLWYNVPDGWHVTQATIEYDYNLLLKRGLLSFLGSWRFPVASLISGQRKILY